MHIAIIGAGGVGGYFGARLAAAGQAVSFIARGTHLEAMRRDGLRVLSPLGDLTLRPVQAESDPGRVGPVDLVVIAVKLWSTTEALESARPLVGPGTAVMSLQNGVEAVDQVTRAFGRGAALGGVAHIAALIEAPGVIRHNGTMARLTLGEADGPVTPRVAAIVSAGQQAGIDAVAADDVRRAIWEKFVFLAAVSGMTSLTRKPIGAVRSDPVTRAMLRDAMAEAAAVAAHHDVKLPADTVDRQLAFCDTLPPGMISSMLGDLERGQRLELEWLSGAVARMGAEAGIPTPAHHAIHAALRLHAGGSRP